MAKRSDTFDTVLLALELLRRIPRRRKVTAKELHQQLKDAGIERDLRTVQRQLEMLSKHYDIERNDSEKPYGYRWLENSGGFAVPNLTSFESLLLLLAEEHLKNILPAHLTKSLEGFFSQAKRNLGTESNAQLEREWPGKVRVVPTSQPLLPPKILPGIFDVVSEALFKNHWLHLEYQNSSENLSTVKVMPLGLAQQGSRLYLVCRFSGFNNERTLALHRIMAAEMSTLTFERPKEFDLKKYDEDGRFGFGEGKRVKLSFHIQRDAGFHLRETPLSLDQIVTELKDGDLKITATVVDSEMLKWWLRGFGDAVSHVQKDPLPFS